MLAQMLDLKRRGSRALPAQARMCVYPCRASARSAVRCVVRRVVRCLVRSLTREGFRSADETRWGLLLYGVYYLVWYEE